MGIPYCVIHDPVLPWGHRGMKGWQELEGGTEGYHRGVQAACIITKALMTLPIRGTGHVLTLWPIRRNTLWAAVTLGEEWIPNTGKQEVATHNKQPTLNTHSWPPLAQPPPHLRYSHICWVLSGACWRCGRTGTWPEPLTWELPLPSSCAPVRSVPGPADGSRMTFPAFVIATLHTTIITIYSQATMCNYLKKVLCYFYMNKLARRFFKRLLLCF